MTAERSRKEAIERVARYQEQNQIHYAFNPCCLVCTHTHTACIWASYGWIILTCSRN